MVEQHVPEGLPAEDLGVPQDDQAILSASQGNIEPPGVTEKADALYRTGCSGSGQQACCDWKMCLHCIQPEHMLTVLDTLGKCTANAAADMELLRAQLQ